MEHGAGKIAKRLDPGAQIDAIELADLHQVQLEARRRHKALFHAACGADKLHFGVVPRS